MVETDSDEPHEGAGPPGTPTDSPYTVYSEPYRLPEDLVVIPKE